MKTHFRVALSAITGIAIISYAGVGHVGTAPLQRAQTQLMLPQLSQPIRCTAEQRGDCMAEFKCNSGSQQERAGCLATRRQCLASCGG
jgi:hypothetical protein